MGKISKKGIIIGAVACAAIGALAPTKSIESIEISVPNYQEEYDINTEIPIDVSVLPDGANTDSIEYITNSDSITFSNSTVNTGNVEGNYEIYVISDDIKSNILSINVVDITACEEAEKKVQKELLAKEAEEQRLAKEAEEKQIAEEQAAKEAEDKRLEEEQAVQEAETKKLIEEANQKQLAEEETTAQATQPPEKSSSSSGDASNFNTYNNPDQQQTTATYVLNTSSKKFHYPSCKSVKSIAPQNYATSDSSREELIAQGYDSCGNCKP